MKIKAVKKRLRQLITIVRKEGFSADVLALLDYTDKLEEQMKKCQVHILPCTEHGYIHGAEANELREGVEELLKEDREYYNPQHLDDDRLASNLERLLNRVDARDSLAKVEGREPLDLFDDDDDDDDEQPTSVQ